MADQCYHDPAKNAPNASTTRLAKTARKTFPRSSFLCFKTTTRSIDVHTPQPLSCRCVANASVCLLCGDRTMVRNVTWCVVCCSVTSCHVDVNGQRERTTCELCETNRIFGPTWLNIASLSCVSCVVCCALRVSRCDCALRCCGQSVACPPHRCGDRRLRFRRCRRIYTAKPCAMCHIESATRNRHHNLVNPNGVVVLLKGQTAY